MSLKNIRSYYFVEAPVHIKVADFSAMHRDAQNYLLRVLFIALRVQEVQYTQAQDLLQLVRTDQAVFVEKAVLLLTTASSEQKNAPQKIGLPELVQRHPDLGVLLDLYFNFTAPVFVRLSFSAYEKIYDGDTLTHAYFIDKALITEFESALKAEFGHSAFEPPKDWGASTVVKKQTQEQIIDALKLQKIVHAPTKFVTVRAKLNKTKYKLT